MKQFDGTTILCARRGKQVALGGDGQVSHGNAVLKGNARKVRRLYEDKILAGFAGGTADATCPTARRRSRSARRARTAIVQIAVRLAAASDAAERCDRGKSGKSRRGREKTCGTGKFQHGRSGADWRGLEPSDACTDRPREWVNQSTRVRHRDVTRYRRPVGRTLRSSASTTVVVDGCQSRMF